MVHFQITTTIVRTLLAAFLALLVPSLSAFDGQKPKQPKLVRKPGTVIWGLRCELQDQAGNLWFSTGAEGVYRFDGTSFTNFTTNDGLLGNEVNSIIEDKSGDLLISTKRGICKYNGKAFSRYSEDAALNQIPVTTLLQDKQGNLWMGTLTSGVYRYDGKKLTNFLNKDRPFNMRDPFQTILDILQDKKGNLWFSSWNGGGVWRYDGRSFTNFLPSADYYQRNEDGRSGARKAPPVVLGSLPPQDTIGDDMIFAITEDKAGNLWFATRNHGACRHDGKTFTTYLNNEGLTSVLEDSKGNMWFASFGTGVYRYDGKSFKNFTTKDGLVNDSVFSVLEDRNGNLWFGTRNCGLSRFDGKAFTTYSE